MKNITDTENSKNSLSSYINNSFTLNQIDIILKTYCDSDINKINNQNEIGWTPLYRTVISGDLTATEILLNEGANPNKQSDIGESPLYQAVDMEQIEHVKLLLKYKADPNITQFDGFTPLHLAVIKENVLIIKYLLKYGANPNLPNKLFQQTPVHFACKNNVDPTILLLLIQYNGSLVYKDNDGKKPYEYATSVEMVETIKKLKLKNHDFFISTNNSINKSKNNSGFKNQIIPTFKNDEDFSYESSKKSLNSNLYSSKKKLVFDFGKELNKNNLFNQENRNNTLENNNNDNNNNNIKINKNTNEKKIELKLSENNNENLLNNLNINKEKNKFNEIMLFSEESNSNKENNINLTNCNYNNSSYVLSENKNFNNTSNKYENKIYINTTNTKKNLNLTKCSSKSSINYPPQYSNKKILYSKPKIKNALTIKKKSEIYINPDYLIFSQSLLNWLKNIDLIDYFQNFIKNGIYNLDILIKDMKSGKYKIKKQDILDLNITKPGHIYRIITQLEIDSELINKDIFINKEYDNNNKSIKTLNNHNRIESNIGNDFYNNNYMNYNQSQNENMNKISIDIWLNKIGLIHLNDNFINNGFDNYKYFILQMFSSIPLNDEILKNEIYIYNDNERDLILFHLNKEVKKLNKIQKKDFNHESKSEVLTLNKKENKKDNCVIF